MATVTANMAMSLDGFIAYPDDSVGELHEFYFEGSEAVEGFGGPDFRLDEPSATLFREALASTGAYLVGRRLYDITNGWNGRPPSEAPMVVLTHEPPADWPRDGVPIHFETDLRAAVTRARELAGPRVVGVAGAAVARACLEAGLLDEIVVNLVPVVLGRGIPFLAGVRSTVRLSDPEIVAAPGVIHLRYRVLTVS
jgi:dihydrofolate reductase